MAADVPSPTSEVRSQSDRQRSKRSDFWALIGCNLVVFCSSICIMVVELCASRLIAPYLGSSLYTWTSVIGIVLAGISIGNYLGGWISEKFTPQKALGWLFLIAGLSTASVLILNRIGASNASQKPEEVPWQFWVMAHVALAWVLAKPTVVAPIVGITKASHLTDAVAALDVRLDDEDLSA
ncbi:MAG: fused MFS/spermidine synthase, partial [Planctomycetota bacterium]|nr:fused MFS/spermidine synthase [Planctomycetota bacterium]